MVGVIGITVPPAIPEHPGLREVATLLQLVSDPDKFNKAIADLETRRAQVNDLIAKVGKASEIDKLHAEAQAAKDAADLALAKAHSDAEDILETHKAQAVTLVSEAQKSADELTTRFQAWNDKLTKKETNLAQADAGLRQREEIVSAKETELVSRETKVTEREHAVEQREAEANRLIEGIGNVIGRK